MNSIIYKNTGNGSIRYMDHNKSTITTWDKVAKLYQDTFMDISLYNDTYDAFLDQLDGDASSVLEIACGPGNITKYLLSRKPDLKIDAIDTSPRMIGLAQINNPTAVFHVMDARNIETLTSRFDGIMCGFCMPYLSKEECIRLIRHCSLLLNKNGIFYFSTIEGSYDQSRYETTSQGDRMYVHYHEEKYLAAAVAQSELSLISTTRKDYTRKNGVTETHLVFLAQKT